MQSEIDYRIFNPNTLDQCTLSMEDIEFDAARIKVILKEQASLIKQKEVDKSQLEEKIRSKLGSLAESIESVNELKPLDPEKIIQIREKSTIGEAISSNNQALIRLYEGIIADSKELLELLSEVDKNDRSDDFFKLATILLRPSQDIEKLLYYLSHKDIEINIELLDNPKRSHAEVNLAKEFSNNKDLYIGVSKLCCGFCDYLLDDIHHIKHRGTHGKL